MQIRWSLECFISTMGFSRLVKWYLYIIGTQSPGTVITGLTIYKMITIEADVNIFDWYHTEYFCWYIQSLCKYSILSMVWCNRNVTPLLVCWSDVSFAFSARYDFWYTSIGYLKVRPIENMGCRLYWCYHAYGEWVQTIQEPITFILIGASCSMS